MTMAGASAVPLPIGLIELGAGTWIAIFIGVILVSAVIWLVRCYKVCPPNRVLVISGFRGTGQGMRCVHSGGAFVIPVIQRAEWLSLEPMQIEIPLRGALSYENIRVNVPSVFTVAIGTTDHVMANAAVRLLSLGVGEIKQQAQDIIFGQLRQVIASMAIEDINRDRDKFLQNVQNSLEPELNKVGLVLVNVNITDITDDGGYIEAIGKKAASQAIQQANIDVAEQTKKGAIGVALAEREQAVKVAETNRERDIAIRQAGRDTAIGVEGAAKDEAVRLAELKREREVGQQTQALVQRTAIAQAEQEMRIATAEANAAAVTGENTSKARIAETEAQLAVKQAEAFQLAESRKAEAKAAVEETRARAQAKAALAEAERVEAEQRAHLEAPAKATAAKVVVDAEADAARQRIEAEAQAAANFARLSAEARGQYEILAKKGEGLQRIIEACGGAQQAFQMLMLEHLEHLADASARAISNIKFDKVVVWDTGRAADGTTTTSNFLSGLAHSLPPLMQTMRDVGGVEIPATLAKLVSEHSAESEARHDASTKADQPNTPTPSSTPATPAPATAQAETDQPRRPRRS